MKALQRVRTKTGSAVPREKVAQAILLALTVPAMLLVNLWWARSERYKHILITLFFTIYGSTMLLGRGDGFRHHWRMEYVYGNLSFSVFMEDVWRILTLRLTESGAKDLYNHVISYLFGGVLQLPDLYFPFVAMVYGYFFAGSVLHILRHFKLSTANYVVLGFVITLLFVRGLEGVYTVRTWTGMWILVYACLKYYETKRLGYLVLMFTPPLVHFGYFMMAIPAWIVLAFGSRPLVYSSILFVSLFTNFLPSQPVTQQIGQTERGAASVSGYHREDERDAMEEFERIQEHTNFYNAFRLSGLHRWAPTFLVIALIVCGVYVKHMTAYQRRIFSIGVLTLAFSNLTWFLFAIHNRTLTIAIVFILAGYLMTRLDPRTSHLFRGLPPYYQWGLHLSLLLFVPLIMFHVSYAMDRVSLFAIIGPFFPWIEPEINISLKEAANWLLRRG